MPPPACRGPSPGSSRRRRTRHSSSRFTSRRRSRSRLCSASIAPSSAKRGWTEIGSAVVAPDRAAIAFTTPDGPALLRLIHQDGRTIADLSLHKPAAANAGILPTPGQARLRLGNTTDEEAIITINERTITLAARAQRALADDAETVRKSPDSPEIDLPPGKYKVTLKLASGAAQNREFEVAADETWGLLAGPDGVPLPLHLY